MHGKPHDKPGAFSQDKQNPARTVYPIFILLYSKLVRLQKCMSPAPPSRRQAVSQNVSTTMPISNNNRHSHEKNMPQPACTTCNRKTPKSHSAAVTAALLLQPLHKISTQNVFDPNQCTYSPRAVCTTATLLQLLSLTRTVLPLPTSLTAIATQPGKQGVYKYNTAQSAAPHTPAYALAGIKYLAIITTDNCKLCMGWFRCS